MRSRCEIDVSGRPHCAFECDEGFVDVDGYLATGCECELWLGEGPPPSAGGDHDCDGIPDETDDFIYVSVNGSDHGAGTLEEPMRTLSAAILRAELTGKDVLVSQGDYRGLVMLRDGVSVYGGYQEGFGDRDLGLYPVRILAEGPSMPALRAQPITSSTTVEGLTIVGSEGSRAKEAPLFISTRQARASFFVMCLSSPLRVAMAPAAQVPSSTLASLGFPRFAIWMAKMGHLVLMPRMPLVAPSAGGEAGKSLAEASAFLAAMAPMGTAPLSAAATAILAATPAAPIT